MSSTTAPERALDRGLLAVAGVVVLGAVMSILDTTVVNVAINTLARDFATSLSTLQWIVTGYTLALATVIPPQRVGRVMAIMGVPMLLGPILGGWLVDDVSWRWIFFINLPIGVIALFLAARILAKDRPQPSKRLDVLGLVLLSPGLALMIYGLAQSTEHGFRSANVLVPGLAGVALLALFVRHALHASNPLIDLRLFLNRTFTTASITLVLMVISVFGAMLLLPLYFQAVRGESALQSGLLPAPQGIGAMLMMPLAGRLTDRTGIGMVVLPGLALVALAEAFGHTHIWATVLVVVAFAAAWMLSRRKPEPIEGEDGDAALVPVHAY